MEMIIGGAFQGKEKLARQIYPGISWIYGKDASFEDLIKCQGIIGFQDYIRHLVEQGEDLTSLASELIRENPDIVLVSDEVGYGVVPVDRTDRLYREAVGRVCTQLAAFSTRVTRVVCGIGSVIKGQES